ncbi:MAG TPA: hypothetical protein VKL61_04255, partial [Candidatus Polarisedimenticolia bacterium]|nr:hypothetical protein [Candidatus Polarisedimenticolia bacterium]
MRTTAEGPRSILASEILRLVPCDRIAFAVPLPNGSGFRIAGVHPEAPPFPDFPIPLHGSCTAHVAATRHGELLSGIGEETRYAEEEPLYRAGIHDAAFVP